MSDRLEKLKLQLGKNPKNILAQYALAMEFSKLEQWQDAIDAFDSVLEMDRLYCAAYYHKGAAQIALRALDQAEVTLRAGIQAAQEKGDPSLGEMEQALEQVLEQRSSGDA